MRPHSTLFFIGIFAVFLSGCGLSEESANQDAQPSDEGTGGTTGDTTDDTTNDTTDDTTDDANDDATDETDPIDIVPTEADLAYMDYWLDRDQAFVSSLKWLPHFIHEQGELGICIKLEFQSPQTITNDLIESIRSKIEERVWLWQQGLAGEPNWVRNTRTPVYLFGIGATPQTEFVETPEVPVYVNDAANCPDACFRFASRDQETPLYEDCSHPMMTHFDFNIWYSDFGFGAAGHGGDWGTRLDWELFLIELTSDTPRVTDHELGHVAGLPDVYLYPYTLDSHDRPPAIMATDAAMQNFDYLMLRKVWELGWEAYYAAE